MHAHVPAVTHFFVQTAESIAAFHQYAEIVTDNRLRERVCGIEYIDIIYELHVERFSSCKHLPLKIC